METKVNQIGMKINIEKTYGRSFNCLDILKHVRKTGNGRCPFSWSWGFKSPVILIKNSLTYGIRFTVSGHHHKGHVYIVLNGLDLFDIYYCSNRGTIKDISNDVYAEDLVDFLDVRIERIKEYQD